MRYQIILFLCMGWLSSAQALDVRCATLDGNFQQTDEYFTVSVGQNMGEVKVLEANTPRFKELPGGGVGKYRVCKRPGMKNSKDFENSYETCGLIVEWKFSENSKKSVSVLKLDSNFNSQFVVLPNYTRSFMETTGIGLGIFNVPAGIEFDSQLASYESKDGKIGHIYSYDLSGKMSSVLRVQCSPELLRIKVKGATK